LLCEYDYDNFSRLLSEYNTFSIEKVDRPYLEKIRTVGIPNRMQRRPYSMNRHKGGNRRRW